MEPSLPSLNLGPGSGNLGGDVDCMLGRSTVNLPETSICITYCLRSANEVKGVTYGLRSVIGLKRRGCESIAVARAKRGRTYPKLEGSDGCRVVHRPPQSSNR
jgi:hypothetical protein